MQHYGQLAWGSGGGPVVPRLVQGSLVQDDLVVLLQSVGAGWGHINLGERVLGAAAVVTDMRVPRLLQ